MSIPTEPEPVPGPVELLIQEHRTMERVLDVLEALLARERAGEGFEEADFGKCVEFLVEYIDSCHREREEKLMCDQGGSPSRGVIGERFHEHTVVRRVLRTLVRSLEEHRGGDAEARSRFLEAAGAYATAQRQHMAKEEETLEALASRPTTPEEQKTLLEDVCHLSCPETEERRRELESLATELGARWLQPKGERGA